MKCSSAFRTVLLQNVRKFGDGESVVARQNSDLLSDQVGGLCTCFGIYPCKTGLMVLLLRLLSIVPTRFFRSRCDLLIENLALRQQLGVFKRKHPRPRFSATDKLFWVMLRRLWAGWSGALILVQPETVVRWHRKASSCIGHGFLDAGAEQEESV